MAASLGLDAEGLAFLRRRLASCWHPPPTRVVSQAPIAPLEEPRIPAAHQDRIIFIALHHGNFPSLQYLAHGLRQRQVLTSGVYLHTAPPEGVYDSVYACQGSLAALIDIVRHLAARDDARPLRVYLQAHGRWTFLMPLLGAAVPSLEIVHELWDWMDLFIDTRYEEVFAEDGVFTRDEIVLMRACERHIRHRAAGFLYKDEGPAMDALLADASAPARSFLPCPPRSWMRPVDPDRRLHHDVPIRLVHAGQLKGKQASCRIFGDLQYHDMIRRITRQDLDLTAFASATPPGHAPQQFHGDYERLSSQIPNFHFHENRPVDRLIADLHLSYDFGILLYPFPSSLCVGEGHLECAIASKLFVYIAAGLPVLVSAKLFRMAEFVTSHGIGLVLTDDAISGLAPALRGCDYPSMCRAVHKAQDDFHLEVHLDTLIAFIRSARS